MHINKIYSYILSFSLTAVIYKRISINYNVVEKFIYFSNSTKIVKLVY